MIIIIITGSGLYSILFDCILLYCILFYLISTIVVTLLLIYSIHTKCYLWLFILSATNYYYYYFPFLILLFRCLI